MVHLGPEIPSMAREKMKTQTWILLLILSCLPNVCQGAVVTQNEKLLLVSPGESANMSCNQNDASNYYMYWYQQKPAEGLKLMILSTGEGETQNMEPDFQSDWELERKDTHNSVLRLKSAKTEDSAVYFCASRGALDTLISSITHYFVCLVGLCQGVVVTQEKSLQLVTVGEPANIHCRHDDKTGAYSMLWYQQKPGDGLALMGISAREHDSTMEENFKGNWDIERPNLEESILKRNGTVSIQDSAVYFCASSYTAIGS
ncbi:T cell receptor beta variable 12-5 [Pelobates cultripes]|nr:T cell receptor beta variable 12-5 [Pelobates cultripes]